MSRALISPPAASSTVVGAFAQAYKTGRGRFLMRAKAAIEQLKGGRTAIIVTEIPYQVNKSKLIKRIAELVNDKVITDIAEDDFRDESDRDGMRIVIGLKRGAEAQIVLDQLYKHTQMQESFSMIFLAVVNGQPRGSPCMTRSATLSITGWTWFAAAPLSCSRKPASASTFSKATKLRWITSTGSFVLFAAPARAPRHAKTCVSFPCPKRLCSTLTWAS